MTTEVQELRLELDRLQARIAELESPGSTDSDASNAVGRRGMLRAMGTAAAGATVGGLAFARPAAAADPNDVVKNISNPVTGPTELEAVPGYTAGPKGVFHVTNDTSQSDLNLGTSCISAIATGSGGGNQDIAISATGSRIGAKLNGPVPLKLTDTTSAGPPGTTGYTGQFRVDNGDLYFCVDHEGPFGQNAVWKRIVGPIDDPAPTLPPQFNAVTPFRVYDSRLEMAPTDDGPLAAGVSRVVPVRDARDVTTGAITTADAVPAGATAVSFNIAIINPTGVGFLTVSPSDATAITAATINWGSGTSGALSNASVTALAGDREVIVFNGPEGTANFTIDVTGYYL